MNVIRSRVPAAEYHALPGISITRLKEIRRSPQHYAWLLDHPRETVPMTLGTAAHTAVLEPERFDRQFAVWDQRAENGNLRPRRGKDWENWLRESIGKTSITEDQCQSAMDIAAAVHSTTAAMRYLESGDPEVTMQWSVGPWNCRGRADWLTYKVPDARYTSPGLQIHKYPVLVGLKTARDCRHFAFGSAAAKLGYHLQWAWYHDGYKAITGVEPKMIEIVVESAPPHAVAVYRIPGDVVDQGREEYKKALDRLDECERLGVFPGPQDAEEEEDLTLPSWAYPGSDGDDITGLALEG